MGMDDWTHLGRSFPVKMRKELHHRPEVMLAAASGLSFVIGATFGSRLGRALLAVAIPIAVERLLRTEVAPRIVEYAKDAWKEVESETTTSEA